METREILIEYGDDKTSIFVEKIKPVFDENKLTPDREQSLLLGGVEVLYDQTDTDVNFTKIKNAISKAYPKAKVSHDFIKPGVDEYHPQGLETLYVEI